MKTKMKVLFFVLAPFFILSCTSNENKKRLINTETKQDSSYSKLQKDSKIIDKPLSNLVSKNSILGNDTLLIDSIKAILYYPDKSDIIRLKKELGEDNYDNVIMDNETYSADVISFLDKKHIPVVQSGARIFIFVTDSNKNYILNKKNFNDKWGVILFNKHKKPLVTNLMGIESTFSNYW